MVTDKAFPATLLTTLAKEAEIARAEAYANIYAINKKAHNKKLLSLELAYKQANPEEGSYEGNFTDDIGDTPEPDEGAVINAAQTNMGEVIKKLKIATRASTYLPALDRYIEANMVLIASKEINPANNKPYIDGTKTVAKFINEHQYALPIVMLYTHNVRSSLIKTQTATFESNYSSLVPPILAVFKRFGYGKTTSIPYSWWTNLDGIVASKLIESMNFDVESLGLSNDDILAAREIIFDGFNPNTTFKLLRQNQTLLADVPQFAAHMMMQTWVASASSRNQYMILDPSNWDNMPSPIISPVVINKVYKTKTTLKPGLAEDGGINWE